MKDYLTVRSELYVVNSWAAGQIPFGNGAGFSRFAPTGIPSQLAMCPKSFPVNRFALQSRRGRAAWGLEGSSRVEGIDM